MFKFHYEHVKALNGDRAVLLVTDINSLVYSTQTDDFYLEMCNHLSLNDTSEYLVDHPSYVAENKKVLGKMKEEMKG